MRIVRLLLYGLLGVIVVVAAAGAYCLHRTETDIAARRDRVEAIARADASPAYDAAAVAALPAPVRRYFAFAFPEPPQRI
ncbi:MAG: hypothetical protein KDA49_10610, partial [Rhodospirillaceae bacterium]|nr:hypothetical protein [Rhodospirillaceae bacterium]